MGLFGLHLTRQGAAEEATERTLETPRRSSGWRYVFYSPKPVLRGLLWRVTEKRGR